MKDPAPVRTPLSTNNSNLPAPVRRGHQVCMQFQRGKCINGYRCRFRHINSDTELRNNDNSSTTRSDFQIQGQFHSRPCFYNFSGLDCPNGRQCLFIHRRQEQSCAFMENFYKTRLCYNWMRSGSCHYGIRCLFAHGETEMKAYGSKQNGETEMKAYGSKQNGETEMKAYGSKRNGVGLQGGGGGGWTQWSKRRKVDCVGLQQCGGGKVLDLSQWSVEKIGRIYGDWLDTSGGGGGVEEGSEIGV